MTTNPVLQRSKKRKRVLKSLLSRKRSKVEILIADDLPWKSISRPERTGLDGDDGILELEEVEGVEVVYEETEAGRVAKFNLVGDVRTNEATSSEPPTEETEDQVEETVTFDASSLLPDWSKWDLHPKILKALHAKSFLQPTPIQAAALPLSSKGRDVIGVAQTGSGKTLAYGLPILHRLLSLPRPSSKVKRRLCALILAPTRELALQVSLHLNEVITCIEYRKEGANVAQPGAGTSTTAAKAKPPPRVSIAAIVGGMSSQKQRRLLDRGIDVLVATPGRLWDLLQDDDGLADEIRNLRFLVLDEADRMIEAGHFAELENILRLTLRESQDATIPEESNEAPNEKENPDDDDDDTERSPRDTLQTFVYSATLSKDLQQDLKRRFRPKGNKKHCKRDSKPASTLDDLLLRLDFRDPKPEVIDLSPAGGVVSTLQEGQIECLSGDKDIYLYYFLLRHPGRSLVFLSSIDGIRRLMPLVDLLKINVFPLHSQLEQRQRLKNLDRFKITPNAVLLATDIAARGLDIPAVDHVIHFQIPRTADTYIHRNGRTARAARKGFSMLMVAPDERRVVRSLMKSLGRDENAISEMSVELSMLDKLKARVQLAKKIEHAQHKLKKSNHDRNWMKEAAETLGVDLDSDMEGHDSNDDKPSARDKKARDKKMDVMKAELREMLSQPLVARGVSTKYITSGSRPIVDDLLAGELNENMLGFRKAEAGSELAARKKRRIANSARTKAS